MAELELDIERVLERHGYKYARIESEASLHKIHELLVNGNVFSGTTAVEHLYLGFYYLKLIENQARAKTEYKLSHNLGNSHASYALGTMYQSQNKLEKAKFWFEKGAESNPNCMHGLGMVALKQKQKEEAQDWLEKGVELGNEACIGWLAYFLTREGRPPEQLRALYEKGAKFGHQSSIQALASILMGQGQRDQTRALYEEQIKLGRVEYTHSLLTLLSDPVEIREWRLKCSALGCVICMIKLAASFQIVGDLAAAEMWYLKAVEKEPSSAMVKLIDFYLENEKTREFRALVVKYSNDWAVQRIFKKRPEIAVQILTENLELEKRVEVLKKKCREYKYAPKGYFAAEKHFRDSAAPR